MRKMLFFDYSQIHTNDGFKRILNKPVKFSGNPLFISKESWEFGNLTMYGSVIKVEGKPFQLWYTVISPEWKFYLAYAESDDGILWEKPLLNIFKYNNNSYTNIVLDCNPHGAAVIYDEEEEKEDWKYKMLAGANCDGSIYAFRSADGIHWTQIRKYPVITTNPDCPMGLLKNADGRYVAYHRIHDYGRRIVFRSESWDFVHWSSEAKIVLEPDAGDPPLIQFYGLGSTMYGFYEIGTLWIYHVDPVDLSTASGYQESELAYSRYGFGWHRAAQGEPFIPHGSIGTWEQGNLQCASAPLFLNNEIRYYYAATNICHSRRWELCSQSAGVGMASIKPDRFVGLAAEDIEATLITMPLKLNFNVEKLFINADVSEKGWIKVGVIDENNKFIDGFSPDENIPILKSNISSEVKWINVSNDGFSESLIQNKRLRLYIKAKNAVIYSIFLIENNKINESKYFDFQPM